MNRDRNLLFGVFAVQLRKVTPSQIMEAAAAWAVDPSKELAERLLAARAIDTRGKALIQRFVDEAIAEYGGDVHATLVAFGGDDQIAESFCGTISLTGSGGVQVTKPALGTPLILSDRAPGVQETPGRYTRESEHARGGMGRVLLVHDEHLGRDIALKELLPLPGESTAGFQPAPQPKTPARLSAGLIARFLQEARITGQLEHPAIVPVYELGTRADNSLYYTMKLVRGGSMAESIRKAATLEDRLKLLPHFVDLCQAIAYAHSRGVIHRDLKPGNVMVGEFGETVVIDWGLAKAKGKKDIHEEELSRTFEMISKGQSADAVNTAYGYALGTPAYMPPEQAKGQLDQIDERSDVYSLGAILYELLTGRLPFKGDSLADTLKKVITEEPRPIREFTPDAPPELAAIAMRAMAKDPNDRYESAKDLAQEVQRFQSGALVRAYEYTLTDRAARFVRRHRAIMTTAAIAFLFLLLATGAYVISITKANKDLIEARDREAEATNKLDSAVDDAARETASKMREEQKRILAEISEADREIGIQSERFRNFSGGEEFKLSVYLPPVEVSGDWASAEISGTYASYLMDHLTNELLTIPRFRIKMSTEADVHIALSLQKQNTTLTLDGKFLCEAGTKPGGGPYGHRLEMDPMWELGRSEDNQLLRLSMKNVLLQILYALPMLQGKIVSMSRDKILIGLGERQGLTPHRRIVAFTVAPPWNDTLTDVELVPSYPVALGEFVVTDVYSDTSRAVRKRPHADAGVAQMNPETHEPRDLVDYSPFNAGMGVVVK